jgi:hypothetical protein
MPLRRPGGCLFRPCPERLQLNALYHSGVCTCEQRGKRRGATAPLTGCGRRSLASAFSLARRRKPAPLSRVRHTLLHRGAPMRYEAASGAGRAGGGLGSGGGRAALPRCEPPEAFFAHHSTGGRRAPPVPAVLAQAEVAMRASGVLPLVRNGENGGGGNGGTVRRSGRE